MRLLVTGAAGFIGSDFVRLVLEREPDTEIVVLDALRYSGNRSTMADFVDRVSFVRAEIQDPLSVSKAIEDHSVSHIVNFAAESHNDRSLLEGGSFVQTNTFGVSVLLE